MSDTRVPAGTETGHDRAVGKVAGLVYDLRAAADWLERHADKVPVDDVYLPSSGVLSLWADGPAEMAAVTRWLSRGAGFAHPVEKDASEAMYVVRRRFGSVYLYAWAPRADVCSQRVVGQRTELVPDPDYPAAPLVERTVDVVEWVCEPLLASGEADA